MKKFVFLTSFVSALLVADFAQAQGSPVNRNQHLRIQQGVRHGQLTRNEAVKLRMQQQRIKGMKQMAKADGRVSPPERKMIRHAQQSANVAIYQQKHDRQFRW